MLLEENRMGDALVLRFTETRLDAKTAVTFKTEFANAIGEVQRVVVDFSLVEFIDSSGLGALVGALKRAGRECEFAVSGLQEAPFAILKLSRMDKVFRIFATEADALAT